MNSNEQEKQSLIICGCTGTTQEKILALIAQGFDLDKISSATGATTGCGACDAEIMDLVNEHTKTI
ncbi:MAG: (2Fe-2S)-binding protein [Methylococcales bacterium]|jgi:NAD(P)H-nitrite reductase large subunit|nr:(2Fe-2S)-binding protein [Methylococcales bacterium]MDG2365498.1 (2Fe-2S)-binding protein [Methylococcaceae bacterium]MBT3507757.1 (2Fe-2S)-binding protein [Methylococcales bacterium]MBT3698085.1 (2Fe-2S)-binding protein [Methylococcales bacterium]MBT4032293.1 (2Fe-2S)-binding protein [Methylococcales bacterium]